eukprot:EG_transcript_9089
MNLRLSSSGSGSDNSAVTLPYDATANTIHHVGRSAWLVSRWLLLGVAAVALWWLRQLRRAQRAPSHFLHWNQTSIAIPNTKIFKRHRGKRFEMLSVDDLEVAETPLLWRRDVGIVALYLAAVAAFFSLGCQWRPLDAVYFAISSMATVGYGDLVPTTPAAKLVTCVGAVVAATLAASALGEMVGRVIDAEKLVAAPAPAARGWVAARALAIIAAIVAAGTIPYHLLEHRSLPDAAYWATMTVMTIGYGDEHPVTPWGKAFASLYILLGTPLTLKALSLIAELPIRARQKRREEKIGRQFGEELTKAEYAALVKELKKLQIKKPGEAAVSKAQFTLTLLVKLGRVAPGDIEQCSEAFDALDVDGNMQLDLYDIQDLFPDSPTAELHPDQCPVCLRRIVTQKPSRKNNWLHWEDRSTAM